MTIRKLFFWIFAVLVTVPYLIWVLFIEICHSFIKLDAKIDKYLLWYNLWAWRWPVGEFVNDPRTKPEYFKVAGK